MCIQSAKWNWYSARTAGMECPSGNASRRINMPTSRSFRALNVLFGALLVLGALGLLVARPTVRAAGPAIQVWLTTPDGVNHLTRQPGRVKSADSGPLSGATTL